MVLNDVTYNLDISLLIILGAIIVTFVVISLFNCFGHKKIKIQTINLGMSGPQISFRCTRNSRIIAYKIWIECVTRTIGFPIDFENDIIRNINNSYYEFFKEIRRLLKEIEIENPKADLDLIKLTVKFLNEVIRPYTTKRGPKFNKWFEENQTSEQDPVLLQRKYSDYNELVKDLRTTNDHMSKYIDELYKIAFNVNK